MKRFDHFLVEILQEEAASARADTDALRNSLRYRLGTLLLQTWPPSIQSIRILWRFVRTNRRRASVPQNKHVAFAFAGVPSSARERQVWSVCSSREDQTHVFVWRQDEMEQVAHCLDEHTPAVLKLGVLTPSLCRRLARLQLLGCDIQWQPEADIEHDPALVAYASQYLRETKP